MPTRQTQQPTWPTRVTPFVTNASRNASYERRSRLLVGPSPTRKVRKLTGSAAKFAWISLKYFDASRDPRMPRDSLINDTSSRTFVETRFEGSK
eukprot:2840165-Prymnesium_polylepis.1